MSYIYTERRCNTINSHVSSSKSNSLNIPNTDNVIGNSNPPRINGQTESSFNILIILQKWTDIESIISINHEIIDDNNISEEI